MTQHIVSSADDPAPHVVMTGGGVVWGERKILNSRKPDLRGGKPATNMIIKQNT
ncbi:hypothetical protein ACT21U_004454 [Escherichia coli]